MSWTTPDPLFSSPHTTIYPTVIKYHGELGDLINIRASDQPGSVASAVGLFAERGFQQPISGDYTAVWVDRQRDLAARCDEDQPEPTIEVAGRSGQCSLCFRRIDPGEEYERQRVGDGPGVWIFKSCAHCQAVLKYFVLDPFDPYEGITVFDYENWADDTSPDLAELRAQAGWKKGWRTQSGALWPCPTLETITKRLEGK